MEEILQLQSEDANLEEYRCLIESSSSIYLKCEL
jgi:hypothetical protein